MRFYALAIDNNGETQVIGNLTEGSRIEAVNEAIEFCKKKGMTFKSLIPVKGTKCQNEVLTKTIKTKKNRKVWF